jgi:hypothetical protein
LTPGKIYAVINTAIVLNTKLIKIDTKTSVISHL